MLRRVLRGLVTAGAVLDSGSRVRVAAGSLREATSSQQRARAKTLDLNKYSKVYRNYV